MADQKIAAPFPAPPPFYKHFTKANITRLRQIRKEAGIPAPDSTTDSHSTATTDPKPDVDLLSLPSELRYLVPPTPPPDGKYSSFGLPIDQLAAAPTLSSAEIEQLYPATATATDTDADADADADPDAAAVRLNPQPHLLALARSLLTTFLALAGALSQDPERSQAPVQDLQTLLYNMHDLINQYRPHQARETLILMMEERVQRMRAEVRAVDDAKGRVRRLLAGLQDRGLQQEMNEDGAGDKEDGMVDEEEVVEEVKDRVAKQRAAWRALEAEMESG